mgnify:CR=1 FL=1
MASQVHRWLLFVFALGFIAAGCLNFADRLRGDPFVNVVAGVFYLCVAAFCMSAHIRSVVGDLDGVDEEESWSSY